MALAHNGNLTNAAELREEFELMGGIFHSTSDTEVIAYTITRERLTAPSIEEAVENAMPKLRGAYSLVVMVPRKLIAAAGPLRLPAPVPGQDRRQRRGGQRELRHPRRGPSSCGTSSPARSCASTSNGVHSIRTHCGKPVPVRV